MQSLSHALLSSFLFFSLLHSLEYTPSHLHTPKLTYILCHSCSHTHCNTFLDKNPSAHKLIPMLQKSAKGKIAAIMVRTYLTSNANPTWVGFFMMTTSNFTAFPYSVITDWSKFFTSLSYTTAHMIISSIALILFNWFLPIDEFRFLPHLQLIWVVHYIFWFIRFTEGADCSATANWPIGSTCFKPRDPRWKSSNSAEQSSTEKCSAVERSGVE